jgi:hypothetical protein
MGNMSNPTLGRCLGRQSRVERSHAINPQIRVDHPPSTAGNLTAFEMEFSEVKLAYRAPGLLFPSDRFSPPAPCSPPRPSAAYSAPLLLLFSEMGRRPWATPEQLEYLKTFSLGARGYLPSGHMLSSL